MCHSVSNDYLERYVERQAEVTQEAETDVLHKDAVPKSMIHAEDAIFRSMNLKAVDACIKEVKDILEMASSFLVSHVTPQFKFEWRFYVLSASRAIFRVRTYSHITYLVR